MANIPEEWPQKVRAQLHTYLTDDSLTRFSQALKKHGALLAGGFVLHAVLDRAQENKQQASDMDIYVPMKSMNAFLTDVFMGDHPILATDMEDYTYYSASLYCRSFLRRNGIKSVRSVLIRDAASNRANTIMIDIMNVRPNRTPLQVVNNFDLTVCQVWYDGETVGASHPQHIINKEGVLQGDYVKTFLEGNEFLIRRMKKYMERGITITLDEEVELPTLELTRCMQDRDKKEGYAHAIRRGIIDIIAVQEARKKNPDAVLQYTLPISGYDGKQQLHNSTLLGKPDYRSFDLKDMVSYKNEYDSEEEDNIKTKMGDLPYYRAVTELYVNTFSPKKCLTEDTNFKPHLSIIDLPAPAYTNDDEWYELWRSLFKARLPNGNEGPLFYLHDHTEEKEGTMGGITEEGFAAYVKDLPNHKPCFFPDCPKEISRVEIAGILGDACLELYQRGGKRKGGTRKRRNGRF